MQQIPYILIIKGRETAPRAPGAPTRPPAPHAPPARGRENRHSAYVAISTSRDNPGLYENPKQWDCIPHGCEKIKDIRQGY